MIQVNQPEQLIGTWRRFGVLGPGMKSLELVSRSRMAIAS